MTLHNHNDNSSNSNNSSNEDGHDNLTCAYLARAALFPSQLLRHKFHVRGFCALLQLNQLRQDYLQPSATTTTSPLVSFSNLFPPRVVVVRDNQIHQIHEQQPQQQHQQQYKGDSLNSIQWNGEPDLEHNHNDNDNAVSFNVIPRHLSVRCSSQACRHLPKWQTAFVQSRNSHSNYDNHDDYEIVLCSNRLLSSSSKQQSTPHHHNYNGDQQQGENPFRLDDQLARRPLFRAVEEALARQLVRVQQYHNKNSQHDKDTDNVDLEIQAALAAECHHQRVVNDGSETKTTKIMQTGRRLPLGYSLWPRRVQDSLQFQCVQAVATQHLMNQYSSRDPEKSSSLSTVPPPSSKQQKEEVRQAVQQALARRDDPTD